MYYLLLALLFLVLYYFFVKVLSSIIKGCLTAFFTVLLVGFIFVMIKSTKEPVYLLWGTFKVDNLKIYREIGF